MRTRRALVTGAAGFVGHHLVTALKRQGYWVRGADIRPAEFEASPADEFALVDLRDASACASVCSDVDEVYSLAANMGGVGYLEQHKAAITHDNALININMLEAARGARVGRYLLTSSACVYPNYRQNTTDVRALREEDAYPADPEDGYGWEKLFAERLCRHYLEDYGLETRVVRFHNVYGPLGAYDGGREKSPAAICRKVALAPEGGDVEVWGDGEQTRSYCYIDDAIEGVMRLMRSDHREPLNIGSSELVSINALVDRVASIAGKTIRKHYVPGAPTGVRGRNSDNTRARQVLGWEPSTPLSTGLRSTYHWIAGELSRRAATSRQQPVAAHAPQQEHRPPLANVRT